MRESGSEGRLPAPSNGLSRLAAGRMPWTFAAVHAARYGFRPFPRRRGEV